MKNFIRWFNIWDNDIRKHHPVRMKIIAGVTGFLFIVGLGWGVAFFGKGGMPYVIPIVAASVFLLTSLKPSNDDEESLRVDEDIGGVDG